MDAAHTLARNRPWLVTKPVRKTGAVWATVAGEHAGEEELVPAEDEADQRRWPRCRARPRARRSRAGCGQARRRRRRGLEHLDGHLGEERAHHPHRDRQVHGGVEDEQVTRCCRAGATTARRGTAAAGRRRRAASWSRGRRTSRRSTCGPAGSTARRPPEWPAAAPAPWTATLAVSELSSEGHGLAPVDAPKNSRYPCRVRGAKMDGGLVAASASLWKDVRSIHGDRHDEEDADQPGEDAEGEVAARLAVRSGRSAAGAGGGNGPDVGDAAHRASSRNRLETVRRAKVAMMIVPMTTTTPAAEARP